MSETSRQEDKNLQEKEESWKEINLKISIDNKLRLAENIMEALRNLQVNPDPVEEERLYKVAAELYGIEWKKDK